jgi:S1-C subfamily serine protease
LISPLAQGATKQEPLLPRGVTLPKDVAVPNDTALAIYFPPGELDSRSYVSSIGLWVEPGKALAESRSDVATKLFPQTIAAMPGGTGQYGLLIAAHPVWSVANGVLRLEMKYRVYDPAGKQLRDSAQVQTAGIAANTAAIRAVTYKAMQMVLVDVLRELTPSAAKYPASGDVGAIPPALLVRHDAPVSTGTGFYINQTGQLLTAAHVVRDCVVIEAQRDGASFPVTPHAESSLLDLAVVDSGKPTTTSLPLRTGQSLTLGEAVTNVGYPLSGLLATTPNLTRGNVSARAGLKGSIGLFQFSAPIQPGSSGGPVVSDGGELLGVTVSTLNVAALVNQGLLPQNVNFALDAKYAAAFLKREKVAFTEVPPRANGSMQVANDAALGAVVQLSCYQ